MLKVHGCWPVLLRLYNLKNSRDHENLQYIPSIPFSNDLEVIPWEFYVYI